MDTKNESSRVFLTPEQAEAMLPPGNYIHTFVQTEDGVTIGYDMKRGEILELIRTLKPQLSGPVATAIDHRLVVFDEHGPVFIETRQTTQTE